MARSAKFSVFRCGQMAAQVRGHDKDYPERLAHLKVGSMTMKRQELRHWSWYKASRQLRTWNISPFAPPDRVAPCIEAASGASRGPEEREGQV